MKFNPFYSFILFFIVSCSISYNTAAQQLVTTNMIWRSSVNIPSQQLTISGQDDDFTITLFIFSGKQSLLRVSYLQNSKHLKEINTLKLSVGTQNFLLKKQISNTYSNQTDFQTILSTQELKIFIHNFTSQQNAYITFNHDVIPIALTGTSSIISRLLQYLDKSPMPELPSPFGQLTASQSTSRFHLPIKTDNPHSKLLYSMGAILLFLLFGKPSFKIFNYIRKKIQNHYYVNKAIRISVKEIKKHANILYIKRDQLLYKDDYGTLIQDKWIQEVSRFIKTTIKPLLSQYKLLEYYPAIQNHIKKTILYIAKQPAPKNKPIFLKNSKKKYLYSRTMNPFDYEKYCAQLLRENGWNAQVTTGSGDQGADVIATKNKITFIIQCKLYKKPVGNKAVQEVNAAKIFYHAQYAAVVSNSSYTISARQLAESTQIALLHHETLQKFARSLA